MAEVVVIGGTNIDIKAKATARHVLATSNPGVVSTTAGGVARNIAHNLARLGRKVALISAVGDDAYATQIVEATKLAGVDVGRIKRETSAPTGTYVALLDDTGNLVSAVSDMRIIDTLMPAQLATHVSLLDQANLIVVDCNVPAATLLWLANHHGSKLVVDPVSVEKSKKLSTIPPLFLATPNLDQAASMFGLRDPQQIYQALTPRFRNLVLHAGPQGAYAMTATGISHVASVPPSTIVDVTGAGDAATSGLIDGLLQGLSLADAAALGQQAASRVIASTKSTLE
jgi:pseudouridine kinase